MANGTDSGRGARGLGVDDVLGETSPPVRSTAPAPAPAELGVSASSTASGRDSAPGAPGLGVDDVLGETSPPVRSTAPAPAPAELGVSASSTAPGRDSAPGAPGLAIDDVLGVTSPPVRSTAPAPAPAPSPAPAELGGSASSTASGRDSAPGTLGVAVDEDPGATASPPRSAEPAPGAPLTPDGSAGRRELPGSRTHSVGNGGDSGPGAQGVCVDEGVGATSSPLLLAAPPSCVRLAPDASGRGAGGGVREICDEVVERLVAGGSLDPQLRTLLEEHLGRFVQRTHSSGRRRLGCISRLQIIKKRKRAEKVKQEKMMESFKAILSDSISFLFPTMVAVFTSNFSFGEYEKSFLILLCALGGLLILLAMVLSHGVEDGPGKTVVVSHLTLGAVVYVFGVLVYCLYKFFPQGSDQIMALCGSFALFIFGATVLTILWVNLFK